MAKITFEGNVGRVDHGETTDSNYISFSVAERYAYFDNTANQWVEKGTEWRECILWIRKGNDKKLARMQQFIVTGAGVFIGGRTSINPSDERDEKGNPKYLNSYVNVDDIALTTERLQEVTYKPKATNSNIANDREMQQRGQVASPPQQTQTVQGQQGQTAPQPTQSQETPFDNTPFPGGDVNF